MQGSESLFILQGDHLFHELLAVVRLRQLINIDTGIKGTNEKNSFYSILKFQYLD